MKKPSRKPPAYLRVNGGITLAYIGSKSIYVDQWGMDAKFARKLARWLTKAADYLDAKDAT